MEMEDIFQKHLNEEEEYMDENINENDVDFGEIGGDWEEDEDEDEDFVGLPVIGVNVFDVQNIELNHDQKNICKNENNESSHENKCQHDNNNHLNNFQRNRVKDITHDFIKNQNNNKNYKKNLNSATKQATSQNQKFARKSNDDTKETNYGNYHLLLFYLFKYYMNMWYFFHNYFLNYIQLIFRVHSLSMISLHFFIYFLY